MEPAVAALLGAAIGALSSLLVGIVSPALRDASSRRRERRIELRKEILVYADALAEYIMAEATNPSHGEVIALGIRAETAANHIAMGLPKSEKAVADMLRDVTLTGISLSEKAARADACMDTLREWYRGEIRTSAVRLRYSHLLTRALEEMTARE